MEYKPDYELLEKLFFSKMLQLYPTMSQNKLHAGQIVQFKANGREFFAPEFYVDFIDCNEPNTNEEYELQSQKFIDKIKKSIGSIYLNTEPLFVSSRGFCNKKIDFKHCEDTYYWWTILSVANTKQCLSSTTTIEYF